MPDDSELVRQVGRGDEAAFRVLVEREARYLYGIAHSLTGNAADAEDLVQETFAGAFKGKFRGEASIRTWLVRILVRRAGMLRRSAWWRKRPRSLDAIEAEVDSPPIEIATPSATSGTEARLDLSVMLASLSPEHRAVIILRELQGLSYEEMAVSLGVPRGTVESRLYRAREDLRKRFKGYL